MTTTETRTYQVTLAPGETTDLLTLTPDALAELRSQLIAEKPVSLDWQEVAATINYLLVDDHLQTAIAATAGPSYTELTEQVNRLTRELADARAANGGMERERRDALVQVEAAGTRLSQFKDQVVEVADRYGREHNLCSVLGEALEELGLELPRNEIEYRAEVTVTFTLYAKREHNRELPDASWVRSSISNLGDIESCIRDVEMDSDHDSDSTEVHGISIRVDSVEEQ